MYSKTYNHRNFGHILDDVLQTAKGWEDLWNEERGQVPVNLQETDAAYILHVIAPGLQKEEFKINLDKNVLTISYEHKEEEKQPQGKILKTEYRRKSFKRNFTLSDKVAVQNITAAYNNGILEVNIPKKEQTETPVQNISVS